MPVMDGMTSTRAIREYEHNRNISRCFIVALTGLASATARLEAYSSGVNHFMTKPINFKVLGNLIKKEGHVRKENQESRRDGEPGSGAASKVDSKENDPTT